MKIRFTRTYEVEVDDAIVEQALSEKINDFYDDDTPDDERSMGIQDVLWWLECNGHLDDAQPDDEAESEMCDGVFEQDFYTLDQLREELRIAD